MILTTISLSLYLQEAITEQQSQLAPPTPRASGSFDPGLQRDTELYNRAPPTPEASGSSLLYMQQDVAQVCELYN